MCDIADEAFEREEWERTLALKNRNLPDPPSPVCRNGDCGKKSQPSTSLLLENMLKTSFK